MIFFYFCAEKKTTTTTTTSRIRTNRRIRICLVQVQNCCKRQQEKFASHFFSHFFFKQALQGSFFFIFLSVKMSHKPKKNTYSRAKGRGTETLCVSTIQVLTFKYKYIYININLFQNLKNLDYNVYNSAMKQLHFKQNSQCFTNYMYIKINLLYLFDVHNTHKSTLCCVS